MTLQIVQDEAADEVLSSSAFALLCGMLLQEQVPIEVAFAGPAKILDRFGSLDPALIAESSPEDFAELCAAEPPIHPYPESMSVLIQALARFVVVNYAGDAASLWQTAGSGEHLLSRLMLLPGFNKRKAQMFIALLGKQMGVRPAGWEQAAGQFAPPDVHRSVADVRDPQSLEKVRNAKSSRKKGQPEAADGPENEGTPSHPKQSKGARDVKTDEEKAEKAERVGARKAARKQARKAANQAAAEGGTAGSATADGTTASATTDGAAESATGEGARANPRRGKKRAAVKAKKAAKRAARREAREADPDAPASKRAARRGAGAGKKAGPGRNARKRAAAGGAAAGGAVAAADGETPEARATDQAAPEVSAQPADQTGQSEQSDDNALNPPSEG